MTATEPLTPAAPLPPLMAQTLGDLVDSRGAPQHAGGARRAWPNSSIRPARDGMARITAFVPAVVAHGMDDPTHPETGAVLSVGRDRYRPRRPRDGWAHGSETHIGNLAHLRRYHHRLKHETGGKVRQLGRGVLEWTSPWGRTTVMDSTLRFDAPRIAEE